MEDYPNPPVHEVVISVQFDAPAPEAAIRTLEGVVEPRFEAKQSLDRQEFAFQVGPAGQPLAHQQTYFDGWQFRGNNPSRAAQTSRALLSLHVVRPGTWPSGQYPGWTYIDREFRALFALVTDAYQGLPVRRAGLRYLNRVAIPRGTEVGRWFSFAPPAPAAVRNSYSLAVRQTWESVSGHDDIAATVALATIEIDDPALKADHVGYLLDIDTFTFGPAQSPALSDMLAWLGRAHAAERQIFEGCITNELRQRFEDTL